MGPSTSTSGEITLASLSSYFGYYGGSPDDYNHVDFYNGENNVGSFDGITLANLANVTHEGDQTVGSFWNFTAQNSNDYFIRVVFSSNENAFETDNHAVLAAVPEPETYAMLLAGLSFMGFVSSRRKNKQY